MPLVALRSPFLMVDVEEIADGQDCGKETKALVGVIVGHSVAGDDFHWCGKHIRRDEWREPDTKEIVVNMETYHGQTKALIIACEKRLALDEPLSSQDVRNKGILGSLRRMVAQVRSRKLAPASWSCPCFTK